MSQPAFKRFAVWAAPAALLTVSPGLLHAEEPRKVTEPPTLREAAEITSVADAFDDGDDFDLHLTLGYQHQWKSGRVLRESNSDIAQLSSGGYTTSNLNVAKYTESTSRLNTKASFGLYKDIALSVRLPVILSHDRKLGAVDGSDTRQSLTLMGTPGEQLFSLPFQSPTRSGIEYLAVGLDVTPLSQVRDATKPTWVIGVEGRFNVSEPMHACGGATGLNQGGGQVKCATPADVNRNGKAGDRSVDGADGERLEGTNFSGSREAGVSRGTTGLVGRTFASKRVKYIEPYGGFEALLEFQNDDSDFGATDLQGSLVNHPPFQGTLVGGLAVIPWEVRDAFQRLEIDFRVTGTYRSEGRDYSPLFDALGSSDAPSLRRPNFAQFQEANPSVTGGVNSVVNRQSQKVYFTGITDVQQHGLYTLMTQLTFQAGEYVKFNVGGSYTAIQGHVITLDQPCNPDFKKEAGRAGPCQARATTTTKRVTGIPNPNYRAVLNAPGRRFRFDDASAVDAWINATVMF